MTTKPALIARLVEIGRNLGFDVFTEVEASESAWVDVVWFDRRLPVKALQSTKPHMRYAPVLPVAAFEVELRTGLNAKHVKGSVSNLSNLGAQLGVIVLGHDNVKALHKQAAYVKKTEDQVVRALRQRVYRWVYAESQARTRMIVMFEKEIVKWSAKLSTIASTESPGTGTAGGPTVAPPVTTNINREIFLAGCAADVRPFFEQMIADADRKPFRMYWGKLGFSVRVRNPATREVTSFAYGNLPNAFFVYFDGQGPFVGDEELRLRQELLKMEIFSSRGQKTLRAQVNATNLAVAQQAWALILKRVKRLCAADPDRPTGTDNR